MEEKTKKSSKVLLVAGLILVVVIIAGVAAFVGFGARHFAQNGMGMRSKEFQGKMMPGRFFGNAGENNFGFGRLSGQITNINGDNLTIKNSSGNSVSIVIADTTSIYSGQNIAKESDLKVNNSVTVLGRPNKDGVVQATAIIIR